MSSIDISKIIYINSANRLNGTNEDFLYQIPISQSEFYTDVCVLQANIPISYYTIESGYNTFQLQEGSSTVTISVTIANYNAIQFASLLTTLFNNNSPNHWVYSVNLQSSNQGNTGKFIYSVSGNSSQPSIIIIDSNLIDVLGFDSNTTNTFIGNSLTSTNILSFIPRSTLYVLSDIIETTGNNSVNILQEIYNGNTMTFSNIVYQCTSWELYSKKLRTNSSNIFRFTLVDEDNHLLYLNGQNFFLTLVLFRKNNTFDLINKFIKYNLLRENAS